MAETSKPEAPGYDPKKWDAQTIAQGQKISMWAITFAEEVGFQNSNKESPEYFKLADEFYTNLEMVSRGERLPGKPSDDPAYKNKLPLGGNPNALEDMHAWLYQHADELNMTPEFIARMSMSPDDRSFYNLLNTRTPTTNADLTASQKDIAFPLGMSGEVGFTTRREFLENYFKVPESQLATLQEDLNFGEVLTRDQKARGGSEHTLGVKEATPKEALVALTKLDIEDMNGIVPEKMGMPAKTADGKPTTERENITRIIELATSLNAKVGERDGNTILLASTPKEFAQIERDARELETLTGSSKALFSYSPNLIVYQSFQDNDPNSATPGKIYSPASIVDGVETIKKMAHSRDTGQQIDPGQSRAIDDLLDGMTLPGDEHSSIVPKGSTAITLAQAGPQSGEEFLKAHPDAHMSEKTKRQLADPGAPIRKLLEGDLDPETRAFYEETLRGIEKSGPKIFTVDPAEVPKGKQPQPESQPDKRGDASDIGGSATTPVGIDRGVAFTAAIAGLYLDMKGVKYSPVEQQTASVQVQRDLPQVMAENTQGKKESYLA